MLKFISVLIVLFASNSSICLSQISIYSLKKDLYFLADDSLEGRYSGTKTMEIATNYLAVKFKNIGLKSFGDSFIQEFPIPPLYGKNIIGFIEGTDSVLKSEYIVLGAHYDHIGWKMDGNKKIIYNGADDNASGISSLMEVAGELIRNRNFLKRSVIIVAFDAEELGLCGSNYFLEHPLVNIDKIKAMISIDMVGWLKKSRKVTFSGYGSFDNGKEFVRKIKKVEGLNSEFLNYSSMWKDRTDTRPFYNKNIPCMYVSTGLKSPYHKPEDDPDSIDFEGLTKISEQLVIVATELSNNENFQFRKTSEFLRTINEPFKFGLQLCYNSNNHDYSEGPFISKSLSGFGGGLITQIELGSNYLLQLEPSYFYYGTKSPLGNIILQSFDFPINILYATVPEMARTFILGGVFINYSFNGSIDGKSINWQEKQYNYIDFGYQIGVGIEFFNVQMSLKGRVGVNDFFKQKIDNIGRATNSTFILTLGYFFLP